MVTRVTYVNKEEVGGERALKLGTGERRKRRRRINGRKRRRTRKRRIKRTRISVIRKQRIPKIRKQGLD